MRLLSLELEKFGAFESLRIAFRRDARLHVVYGPNEAGKSTALAAVGALLFGVPERTSPTSPAFRARNCVSAAEIVASRRPHFNSAGARGARTRFRRRRGDPLPDEALAPFLGGLSEERFAARSASTRRSCATAATRCFGRTATSARA